jgi:type IV pilus assembly protein PilV
MADLHMHSTFGKQQIGFTLVEVLVSVLVMSIGLLGVGKLVLFSSRANDSAYQRSQATQLAYAILDDMRANRQTALSQGYDVAAASAVTNPGVTCDGVSPCTTGTVLAQFDLFQWRTRLLAALGPTGNGSVTTAAVPNALTGITSTTATITVQWDDTVARQSFGAAAGNGAVTMESVL